MQHKGDKTWKLPVTADCYPYLGYRGAPIAAPITGLKRR
jgi:hypothetical protein